MRLFFRRNPNSALKYQQILNKALDGDIKVKLKPKWNINNSKFLVPSQKA